MTTNNFPNKFAISISEIGFQQLIDEISIDSTNPHKCRLIDTLNIVSEHIINNNNDHCLFWDETLDNYFLKSDFYIL